ncbi:MAG TPA: hypothetical protein VKP88_05185 [Candidatus Paceibacterota bacterium]|nr:hypothetical protein [Candidatus Paceibacterota bacterium]
MAENRIPRDTQSRAQAERPQQWKPPELLPEPIKEEGFSYRWIRVSTLNADDPRNVSAKMREGWEPVTLEEQPQMKLFLDRTTEKGGNIEIGGLMLCKTPSELVRQRNDYYANQSALQTESVDNSFMRQSDPRMPLFKERKSTSSFGKGS